MAVEVTIVPWRGELGPALPQIRQRSTTRHDHIVYGHHGGTKLDSVAWIKTINIRNLIVSIPGALKIAKLAVYTK